MSNWDNFNMDSTLVYELPCAAEKLDVENGCLVAHLVDGSKHLIPIEGSEGERPN